MILSYVLRDWFSGRMTAFQAVEKGSIPLSRTENMNFKKIIVSLGIIIISIVILFNFLPCTSTGGEGDRDWISIMFDVVTFRCE